MVFGIRDTWLKVMVDWHLAWAGVAQRFLNFNSSAVTAVNK